MKLVERAGESLTVILSASQKVAGNIADISTATGEQAHGVDEVSHSVSNMDAITQANAALAEQSATSATLLSEKAASLHTMIASFNIGAGALQASGGPAPPAERDDVRKLRELAASAYGQSRKAPSPARKVASGGTRDTWEF